MKNKNELDIKMKFLWRIKNFQKSTFACCGGRVSWRVCVTLFIDETPIVTFISVGSCGLRIVTTTVSSTTENNNFPIHSNVNYCGGGELFPQRKSNSTQWSFFCRDLGESWRKKCTLWLLTTFLPFSLKCHSLHVSSQLVSFFLFSEPWILDGERLWHERVVAELESYERMRFSSKWNGC